VQKIFFLDFIFVRTMIVNVIYISSRYNAWLNVKTRDCWS